MRGGGTADISHTHKQHANFFFYTHLLKTFNLLIDIEISLSGYFIMETIVISLSQLRGMIGQQVVHQGKRCVIVEVLEQHTELVLQIEEQHTIQPDQYGEAHRLVPGTITIPVLNTDKTELHASFLALELL